MVTIIHFCRNVITTVITCRCTVLLSTISYNADHIQSATMFKVSMVAAARATGCGCILCCPVQIAFAIAHLMWPTCKYAFHVTVGTFSQSGLACVQVKPPLNVLSSYISGCKPSCCMYSHYQMRPRFCWSCHVTLWHTLQAFAVLSTANSMLSFLIAASRAGELFPIFHIS